MMTHNIFMVAEGGKVALGINTPVNKLSFTDLWQKKKKSKRVCRHTGRSRGRLHHNTLWHLHAQASGRFALQTMQAENGTVTVTTALTIERGARM